MQVFSAEISTREVNHVRLTPPTDFPLLNPPCDSPTVKEQEEPAYGKIRHAITSTQSANPLTPPNRQSFSSTFTCCVIGCELSTLSVVNMPPTAHATCAHAMDTLHAVLLHPAILTDLRRLYSASLRLPPKTIDGCAGITLAFLRDAPHLVSCRFVDAAVNLGDVGTHRSGSLAAIDRFIDACRFSLTPARREKRE